MQPDGGKRNRIILVVLILLSVFMLTIYYRYGSQSILFQARRVTLSVVSPIQKGVAYLIEPFQAGWKNISEFGSLRRKNARLKEKVQDLRKQVLELEEEKIENERLRNLLGFKKKYKSRTVLAQVIGRSITPWETNIIIDKGSDDGVKENSPVVVSEGLVGQVVELTSHASQVQLIIDQKSGVAAQILKTGDSGIVQGKMGRELELDFIAKEAKVKKGYKVITSGLGGVYPKGIYIGKVSSIRQEPYSLYKEVKLESRVDFDTLEEVLIITNPLPKTPYRSTERKM